MTDKQQINNFEARWQHALRTNTILAAAIQANFDDRSLILLLAEYNEELINKIIHAERLKPRVLHLGAAMGKSYSPL